MTEEKGEGKTSNLDNKSYQIQNEIRSSVEEYHNAIIDLQKWAKEVKEREKQRNNYIPIEPVELNKSSKQYTNQQNTKQKEAAKMKPSGSNLETKKDSESNSLDELKIKKEADALKDKGNVHVKLSEFKKAISCYTEALNKNENDPVYYANRALCYLKLERYNECIKDCNHAIKLDSKYSKAFYRRMQAYEGLGDNEKAFKDCKNVLDIEPKNNEANSCFVRLKNKLGIKEFNDASNLKSCPSTVFKDLPNDVIEIEAITKPPHLRSKVPLKRIQIVEVIETSSKNVLEKTNKNAENLTIASNHISQLGGDISKKKTAETEKNSTNISKSNNQPVQVLRKESASTDISSESNTRKKTTVNLKPPKTTSEFYATWRELLKEQKYLYLKSIEPANINKILGAGLNSEILSDIISILSEHFVNNGDNIEKILFNISNHSEVSILSCFLSEDDKKGLLKLIDYIEKQNNSEHIKKIQTAFSV